LTEENSLAKLPWRVWALQVQALCFHRAKEKLNRRLI
jgi:hypothetical protein